MNDAELESRKHLLREQLKVVESGVELPRTPPKVETVTHPKEEPPTPANKNEELFKGLLERVEERRAAEANSTPQKESEDSPNAATGTEQEEIDATEIVGQIWYAPRCMSITSIPNSLDKDLTEYSRENGNCTLELSTTHKSYGLPSGRDRIFYYWAISKALFSNSERIAFSGVSPTLREIGLNHNSGSNQDWLKACILRGAHTLLRFNDGKLGKGGSTMAELLIPCLENFSLDDKDSRRGASGFIHLSKNFIESGLIPIDPQMIFALEGNYTAIDLYIFLRKRLYNAPPKDIFIPLSDLRNQFGFSEDVENKYLKQYLKRAINGLQKAKFAPPLSIDKKNLIVGYVKIPRLVLSAT